MKVGELKEELEARGEGRTGNKRRGCAGACMPGDVVRDNLGA